MPTNTYQQVAQESEPLKLASDTNRFSLADVSLSSPLVGEAKCRFCIGSWIFQTTQVVK